ncbi:MAG: hypothetical protein CV087_07770 [Candidatus Brocadia sp. WS118]|nr:MAG: hypothetical protein CV087_07770 [Candidatus Brocadia sp. WS118]
MVFLRFCTVIIGLIMLTFFITCSGTLNHPGVPTARAADMFDSNKGVVSSSPRFTDNSNGTVTDTLTGLTWLQNANVAGARTWTDALADVENLNRDGTMNGTFAGDKSDGGSHQKDWRLPNRNELSSLTDSKNNNPALPSGYSGFFSGVQSDSYWSSDTLKGGIAYAWIVNMSDHGIMDTANKNETCYVWPVRAGK